jgi:hypothetical protein
MPVLDPISARATTSHPYRRTARNEKSNAASVGLRSRNEKRESWRPDPTGSAT